MTDSTVLLGTALACVLLGGSFAYLLIQGRVRAAADQARGQAAAEPVFAQEQLRFQSVANQLESALEQRIAKLEQTVVAVRELNIKPSKNLSPALRQLRSDDAEAEEAGSERQCLASEEPANVNSDEGRAPDVVRPGRRVDPTSKLSRTREIVLAHIDTHKPRDIKRLLVETLGVSPAVANTYFCQVRDVIQAAATA